MAPRGLTPIAIKNLKPRTARYEVSDPGCKGLRVVVQPTGARGFLIRYRRPDIGTSAKLTLGPWRQDPPKGEKEDPVIGRPITLAGARKLATDALHKLKQDVDPGAAKLEAKRATKAAKADTLQAIAEEYLKREGPKLRTLGQRRDTFERLIYPVLGSKPITEIKRSDVVKLLDKVEDGSGPRMADECLTAVRRLFNWHATRTDDFRTPIVRGMARAKPASERARDRVLSDDEVRRVWHAGDAFVRFLLLTSARRNEAARMTWVEIEGLDWCLPAARNKTKQDLIRPLSAAALAVLASVPRSDDCPFVFTSGRRPINNFSRMKREIDAASGVTGWTLHDLRRTARSLMSRAGVNPDHAERCLGHVIGGIRGNYDRHEFYDEKKLVFEKLAAVVERIVEPQDNVTALRGQRA